MSVVKSASAVADGWSEEAAAAVVVVVEEEEDELMCLGTDCSWFRNGASMT
jgi:hypothetical protein